MKTTTSCLRLWSFYLFPRLADGRAAQRGVLFGSPVAASYCVYVCMMYLGFSDGPAVCVEITHCSSRRWTEKETHAITSATAVVHDLNSTAGMYL